MSSRLLLNLTESEVADEDEPGLMLLTFSAGQLITAAGLARRTDRTPALALDAEQACHSGRLAITEGELQADGADACRELLAQPAFMALRSLRRTGNPRETWTTFKLRAAGLFPGVAGARLDLITALEIRADVAEQAARQ